ncbi:MAG: sulfurtransferase, partial [Gammaproteobacteria bacterium]|nr:sulfurtransferase [Gammaproteobacteria bacterium]
KGSTFTDYAQWRTTSDKGINAMLPTKSHIEQLLSKMGATAESHIVLVPSGESASDLASATRIYWTLEQIGHKKKSILDGGIIAYANAKLPLERGPSSIQASEYKIKNMKHDQINADTIHTKKTHGKKAFNLIDARSKAEYLGIYQGAPDERAGTIPGSEPLPFDWFTQNGGGKFATPENLQLLMASIKIDKDLPTVVYCHTGHRASLSWFLLHEILENDNAILYDGSTREWASRSDLPVDQLIAIQH